MQFVAPYTLVPVGNLALHFHPEHLSDLRASGLSDDTIRAAGVYSMRPGRAGFSRFFSKRSERGKKLRAIVETALCFPYQGGEFARIKLFPPVNKMKYAQPPGTGARLYMPFAIGDGPLFVVEGEKKTLAAHQAGLNSVGVGGLWNWLSNGEPIDDLKLVDWDGREVTIVPDSDVFDRPDLLRAVYALGRELQSQGASVYVAQIPQADAAKVGLDDFLVAGGKVSALEVFSLGHSTFKRLNFWHSDWKFKRALREAA